LQVNFEQLARVEVVLNDCQQQCGLHIEKKARQATYWNEKGPEAAQLSGLTGRWEWSAAWMGCIWGPPGMGGGAVG